MSVDQDKESLLDALYARSLDTGMRPSLWEAQMKYLPEWNKDRMLDAAQALEAAGDIVNVTPRGAVNVDLSSTARSRAQARANSPQGSPTTYNIGSMSNSPLQHVAAGAHGVQSTSYQVAAADLRTAVNTYHQHVDELGLDPNARRKADKAVATIEAQIADDEPDQAIVKSAGKSLKTIIEGAVGGALGNAAANPGVWTSLLSLFT